MGFFHFTKMNSLRNLSTIVAVFLILNIIGQVQCHRLEAAKVLDSKSRNLTRGSLNDTNYREARRSVVSGGIFSIISFDNVPCNSTSGDIGVCYSPRECTNLGGVAGGSCAGNFGVCCSVQYSSGSISTNNSYFVNPGYPGTVSGPLTQSVTVTQIKGATELYLEFTVFSIRGPNSGACTNDTFTVTVSGTTYPVLCGINTGQSLYVPWPSSSLFGRKKRDLAKKFSGGNKGDPFAGLIGGTATLTFTLAAGSDPRTWKIRIVQFKATDSCAAPVGCNQWFQGTSGTAQTYNYNGGQGELIENSGCYTQCFRTPAGSCLMLTENEFMLPGTEPSTCTTDYLLANGVKYCGQSLNTNGMLTVTPGTGMSYTSIQYCTGGMDPDMDTGYSLQYNIGACPTTG